MKSETFFSLPLFSFDLLTAEAAAAAGKNIFKKLKDDFLVNRAHSLTHFASSSSVRSELYIRKMEREGMNVTVLLSLFSSFIRSEHDTCVYNVAHLVPLSLKNNGRN